MAGAQCENINLKYENVDIFFRSGVRLHSPWIRPCERDSRNLTQNLLKKVFSDEEKKRKEKKHDAYFCAWGYNELNVIKYLSISFK